MSAPGLDDSRNTFLQSIRRAQSALATLDDLGPASHAPSVEADDPEPIRLEVLAVPSFQASVIPVPWLRDMIEAVARATETPTELSLLLGLAVVATAVQRGYTIEPEVGYTEPLNVWVCPALDPGNRKTAVLKELTAALSQFEQQSATKLAPDIARADATRRLGEDRIKHLRQKAARADGTALESLRQELFSEEAALPDVPQPVRLWAQDVTPEKLGVLMADHGEALAILSDEGGLFDILGGRYSQGAPNLDLFLQAHSAAPFRVDRSSRPSIFLERPVLTIGLSPQPSVIRGLADMPGFRGRGLLARFLFALPTSSLGFRSLTPCPVPETVRESYTAHIHALLRLTGGGGSPRRLTLSSPAHAEWKAFQRHVEEELRPAGRFETVRDWASKLPGAVARLAGVLHCAGHADGAPERLPVSLATTQAALEIGAHLEHHALAAFNLMAVDTSLDGAQKAWGWIARHRQDTFTRREAFKGLQGQAFPDVATVGAALDALVERNYLFPIAEKPRAGRPSPAYRVNRHLVGEWS